MEIAFFFFNISWAGKKREDVLSSCQSLQTHKKTAYSKGEAFQDPVLSETRAYIGI